MKVFCLSTLALLVFLGCSSNVSTNPLASDAEFAATLTATDDASASSPITEIEPEEPLCETEHYGYIKLINMSRILVRCTVGNDIFVDIAPHADMNVQADEGWQNVTWSAGGQLSYTEAVPVPTCKTILKTFSMAQACAERAMQ
ncbi:MAG: hypothetical protein IPG71_12590 [bacterium]|nr:hypothetical protein [bacterium]